MSGLVIAESMEDVTRLVRGHACVEVFDERGRLVQKEEADNFIAVPMLTHSKWMVRADIAASWPGVSTDTEPSYPWYRIMLTDSSKAESSGTEGMVPGRPIAWANRAGYSGSAPTRGVPNVTESTQSPTQSKWVFDWGTGQGIGTFQSMCWGFDCGQRSPTPINRTGGETAAWWPEAGLMGSHYGLVGNIGSDAGQSITLTGMIHEESTGTVWSLTSRGSTQIQKFTTLLTQPTTALGLGTGINIGTGVALSGALANDFTVANGIHDMGYPGSGGAMWGTQSATPWGLQRFNFPAGGAVQQTVARPWPESEAGFVAFDGTNLYCCRNGAGLTDPNASNIDPSGPVTIYKVRASDGVTLGSWTHPRRVYALGWDPTNSRLLVGDGYGFDTSNNATGSVFRGHIIRAVAYDTTGNFDWTATVLWPRNFQIGNWALSDYCGLLGYAGDLITDIRHTNNGNILSAPLHRFKLANLGARALLGAPVTKSSLQTMKVTHTITYT